MRASIATLLKLGSVAAATSVVGACLLHCSPFASSAEGNGSGTTDAMADGGSVDGDGPDGAGPVDAGDGTTVVASGQGGVTSLAHDGKTLYWAARSDGAVRSCALEGCSKPADVTVGGQPSHVAWTKRLFWADETAEAIFFLDDAGKIAREELSGLVSALVGDSKTVYGLLTNVIIKLQDDPPSSSTTFLGFNSTGVYGAAYDGIAWATPADVRFCPATGSCSEASSLVAAAQNATALAVDGAQIFWTTSDGHLRARERSGGSVVELATALPEPSGVASDPNGPYVYFTARGTSAASYADGFVGRVARGGGDVTVLARNQHRPEAIVLAGGDVYWANTFDGTIRRAPK